MALLLVMFSLIACGKEGLETTYYDSGQVMEKINYKSGRKEGEYIKYFSNGNINIRQYYQNGEKEGYRC